MTVAKLSNQVAKCPPTRSGQVLREGQLVRSKYTTLKTIMPKGVRLMVVWEGGSWI